MQGSLQPLPPSLLQSLSPCLLLSLPLPHSLSLSPLLSLPLPLLQSLPLPLPLLLSQPRPQSLCLPHRLTVRRLRLLLLLLPLPPTKCLALVLQYCRCAACATSPGSRALQVWFRGLGLEGLGFSHPHGASFFQPTRVSHVCGKSDQLTAGTTPAGGRPFGAWPAAAYDGNEPQPG